MSEPVSEPAWPNVEPYGLVYEEADFLGLVGVHDVGEAAAEPAAETTAQMEAVLALA